MNKDEFESKWKEMRGQIKRWWGILTDFDLDRMDGKSDRLIELLQRKYGYTRELAEEEFNQWLKQTGVYENRAPAPPFGKLVKGGPAGETRRPSAIEIKD